jgi:hypothetical protein
MLPSDHLATRRFNRLAGQRQICAGAASFICRYHGPPTIDGFLRQRPDHTARGDPTARARIDHALDLDPKSLQSLELAVDLMKMLPGDTVSVRT